MTTGDAAFYGTMDGWFKAVHARSGEVLGNSSLSPASSDSRSPIGLPMGNSMWLSYQVWVAGLVQNRQHGRCGWAIPSMVTMHRSALRPGSSPRSPMRDDLNPNRAVDGLELGAWSGMGADARGLAVWPRRASPLTCPLGGWSRHRLVGGHGLCRRLVGAHGGAVVASPRPWRSLVFGTDAAA